MQDKTLTWHSFQDIAEALQDKYPETDLLTLDDEKLSSMLVSLPITRHFPPFPTQESKDIFFAVKVAWARLIEGDADYDAHEDDAYV